MTSLVKIEWRLRLQKLNESLHSWKKKADSAVREWSHFTEVGLQHVYHGILRGMIAELENAGYKKARLHEVIIERPVETPQYSYNKVTENKLRRNLEVEMAHSVQLLERLEDEITKRRIMDDEIHRLKREVNELKTNNDRELVTPLTFRSLQLPLSSYTPRSRRSFREILGRHDSPRGQEIDEEYPIFSARSDPLLTEIKQRRGHETKTLIHTKLLPDVNNTMFDKKPSTIARDFKSLFDHEWTKLYADMRKFYSDQYVIDLLLSWLKDCYLTCIAITEEQRENIRDDALRCFKRHCNGSNVTRLPASSVHVIKEFQNKIASDAFPLISKVCERRLLSGEENADYPLKFISKCSELCWSMATQTPPMVLNFETEKGDMINRKLFSSLIPRGEEVDCLVWPAVMRYTNGHMLQRGVVKTVVS